MHSVRAYKMIFAVLERRLIQLLIKWSQFFINNLIAINIIIAKLQNFLCDHLVIFAHSKIYVRKRLH